MDAQHPDITNDPQREAAFAAFKHALEDHGLRAALQRLNEGSAFRRIGIFRFDGEVLHCLAHVDRDDEHAATFGDQPVVASYCCYVRDRRGAFTTLDALQDPAAVGHPKREALRAYCGVPVMDAEGQLFGTLCQFDEDAQAEGAEPDLELMVRAAAELGRDGRLLRLVLEAART
jgi:GAF domain-containing protein